MGKKVEMKIRKAKKSDLNQYVSLVGVSNKEYEKIIGKKIKFRNEEIIRDFNKYTRSKNKIILVSLNKRKIIGYLVASIKTGHIDFLYVSNRFRKRGVAKRLIRVYSRILQKKRVKRIRLEVNPRNKKAIKFYEKIGFKNLGLIRKSKIGFEYEL